MRTETRSHTYKTFVELSEANQDAIIEKRRDWNVDHNWWEFTYEDAKRIGALFGFDIDDIEFSGFWSQGDGARCSGTYSLRPEYGGHAAAAAVRVYAPQDETLHGIVGRLAVMQEKYHNAVSCKVSFDGCRYSHEYCTSFDFGEIGQTEVGEDGEWEMIWMLEDDEKEVVHALRAFMKWIYRQLESKYEYLTGDDTLRERFLDSDEEFEVRLEDIDGDVEEELVW